MNEEKYIRDKMGTRNPFTVPDGYFDKLADQVIGRLPAESVSAEPADGPVPAVTGKPAAVRYLRPLLYAAACAVLALALGTLLRNSTDVAPDKYVAKHQEATATYSDTYMEDMADYAMLDNEDIYASLLADL